MSASNVTSTRTVHDHTRLQLFRWFIREEVSWSEQRSKWQILVRQLRSLLCNCQLHQIPILANLLPFTMISFGIEFKTIADLRVCTCQNVHRISVFLSCISRNQRELWVGPFGYFVGFCRCDEKSFLISSDYRLSSVGDWRSQRRMQFTGPVGSIGKELR